MNASPSPQNDAMIHTYNTYKYDQPRLNLSIPPLLWKALDVHLQKQINRIRQELRAAQPPTAQAPSSDMRKPQHSSTISKQYPSQTSPNIEDALATVQRAATTAMTDTDSDTTVDEDFMRQTTMVNTSHDNDDLDIHASFRHALNCNTTTQLYGITDDGADSTILGSLAKVINHTGRYAQLVGYNPDNTKSGRVPIVLAYQKTQDSHGKYLLLLIHEAPHLAHSHTTLFSEFQIRAYGKVLDSCSTGHVLCSDPLMHGKQRFELNEGSTIQLVNRGGIMGLPIFPFADGDETKYPIVEITSKSRWTPQRYRQNFDDDTASISYAQHTKTDFLLGRV